MSLERKVLGVINLVGLGGIVWCLAHLHWLHSGVWLVLCFLVNILADEVPAGG